MLVVEMKMNGTWVTWDGEDREEVGCIKASAKENVRWAVKFKVHGVKADCSEQVRERWLDSNSDVTISLTEWESERDVKFRSDLNVTKLVTKQKLNYFLVVLIIFLHIYYYVNYYFFTYEINKSLACRLTCFLWQKFFTLYLKMKNIEKNNKMYAYFVI